MNRDHTSMTPGACFRLGDHGPDIPPNGEYWIAPGAYLIGNVVLRRDASVWFGAVIRADDEPISIGERSNIQDGCVLHVDPGFPITIGVDCTVGHRVILHGCTIGDGSLIGMGSTILNGAKIGRNCLIGANTLITEGKNIPDNSLVTGVPGKVIRQLDKDAARALVDGAGRYVRRWREYVASLHADEGSGEGLTS